MRHLFLIALIAGLGFSFPVRTLAQKSTPDQIDPFVALNRKQSEDPSEITFSIRLKENRNEFQKGEIIQLELIFSSSIASRFTVNRASYDRSGRLHIDDFIIDRESGTADPLSDYFNSLFGIMMSGGLTGFHDLDDKPFALTTAINEWLRFDEPGQYRLYVVSKRVGRKRSPEYVPHGNPPLIVSSNIIEFEIVPANAKWAKQKIAEAVTGFGQSKNDQQRRAGCRTLRFLGTHEAVIEMAKRLGAGEHGCDREFSFGLIGSPHRGLVISEMERTLAAPSHPVNSTFLNTLALLVFATQEPKLPPYPVGNEAAIKSWQALNAARRERFAQILVRYIGDLVNAIPSKHEDARAASLETLLAYQQNVKADGTLAKDIAALVSTLPDLFQRLRLESQTNLLKYQWKPFAQPAMLPVLQKIYEPKQQKEPDSYQQRELRTIALTRLYELAPEEGRRLILEEISRLEPRVNFTSLGLLPDETLPELDETLATHLEQTQETGKGDLDAISALIERYATATILPRVQAFFAPKVGRWACRTQSALLAYTLRVDPPTGADLIAKALRARGNGFSRCYPSTLTEVAALHMAPEIEAAAIEVLEEDDPEMVAQAAAVLRQHGSARAEKVLWERFERWHREKQGHAVQFAKLGPGNPGLGAAPLTGEVTIENALGEALSKGQAWLADSEKLERLRALYLTQYGLAELNNTIREANPNINIGMSQFHDKPYMIRVAQYELKSIDALRKKLLQFPRGTVFRFSSDQNPRSQQLFQELKNYLDEQGMGLEEP